MNFEDVIAIYNGPKDSVTQYFKQMMSGRLGDEMRPIINSSMANVGAIQAYDKVMGNYGTLPFVPDVKTNLTDHVVGKGMDGVVDYIA
jgi:hypothetical protein